jgi:endonuclease-8
MLAVDLARTACAMRTALVGRPMVRFDAPQLIGPVPEAGRMVEVIEANKKHLEVTWDDGLVLDTHLKGSSEWHVYRNGDPWRRSYDDWRASIQTDDWVAVCFNAATVETYRQPDGQRHPGLGRLGPDLRLPTADVTEAIELLLSYPNRDARLRDVLVDQHVMQGVGNVFRCELLWAAQLSPWTHIADLKHHDAVQIVNSASAMVRANAGRVRRSTTDETTAGLAVYGRCGQGCVRCHETIEARPVGTYGRTLYWCPGCQVRHDRELPTEVREMDPHPAAVKFMNDLRLRAAND